MLAAVMLSTGCATRALWDAKVYRPVSVPNLMLSPQTNDVLVRYNEKCFAVLNNSKPLQAGGQHPADQIAAAPRTNETHQLQPRAYWLFASTNRAKYLPPEFVDPTNSSDWVSVPVAKLDTTTRISKHADLVWLRRDERWVPRTKPDPGRSITNTPERAHSIAAGTNALGQSLYITNAPPEHRYYWKLSSSPQRYLSMTNAPPPQGYYAASFGNNFALWRDGQEAGIFALPTYSTHGQRTFWRVVLTPVAISADVAVVGVIIGAAVAIGAGPGVAGGFGSPAPAVGAIGHL